MITKLERAKHTIEKATRKENLQRMILEIKKAQKDDSLPLKLYFKRSDGLTVMCTAQPVASLQEL